MIRLLLILTLGMHAYGSALTADGGVEWDQAAQTFTAVNNANITHDGKTFKANKIIAYYSEIKDKQPIFSKIEATGRVNITEANHYVYAQSITYDISKKLITATSDVRVHYNDDYHDNNIVLSANQLRIDIPKSTISASGNAKVTSSQYISAADNITATLTKITDQEFRLATINATGNVAAAYDLAWFEAEKIVWNAKSGDGKATGNPVQVEQGDNIIIGNAVYFNSLTKNVSLKSNTRVSGRYLVKEN